MDSVFSIFDVNFDDPWKEFQNLFDRRKFKECFRSLSKYSKIVSNNNIERVLVKFNTLLCEYKGGTISWKVFHKKINEVKLRLKKEIEYYHFVEYDSKVNHLRLIDHLVSLIWDEKYFNQNKGIDFEKSVISDLVFVFQVLSKDVIMIGTNCRQKNVDYFEIDENYDSDSSQLDEDEDEDTSVNFRNGPPKKKRKVEPDSSLLAFLLSEFRRYFKNRELYPSRFSGFETLLLFWKIIKKNFVIILSCREFCSLENSVFGTILDFINKFFDPFLKLEVKENKFSESEVKKIQRESVNNLIHYYKAVYFLTKSKDVKLSKVELLKIKKCHKQLVNHNFLLGYIYFLENDLKLSKQHFFLCNDNPKACNYIGLINFLNGDFEGSVDYFSKNLGENIEQNGDVFNERERESVISLYNNYVIHDKLKSYEKAFKFLQILWKVLYGKKIGEDNFRTIPTPINVMYEIAFSALKVENYSFSSNAFEYLIDSLLNKKNESKCYGNLKVKIVHLYRGYIHSLLNLGKYEKCLDIIEQIIKIFPKDIELLMYKCDALLSLGRTDNLLNFVVEISKIEKKRSILIFNNLAICFILKGAKKKALEILLKALDINIFSKEVVYNVGLVLLDLGIFHEACVRWFRFRNIETAKSVQFYLDLAETKKEDLKYEKMFGNVMGRVKENDMLLLDIELLYRYVKGLQEEELKNQIEEMRKALQEKES